MLGIGCGPAPAPAPPPVAESGPSRAPQPPAPSAPAGSEGRAGVAVTPRLPIAFEPVQQPQLGGAPPGLEIKFPILGKSLPLAQARTYKVRLKATHWPEGAKAVLMLDDYPPRSFDDPAKPIDLGELVPANRELEAGLHRLFAATQLADGTTVRHDGSNSLAPIAYVPFWLGQATDEQASELMQEASGPQVVMLSPRGTFNGAAAADNVLVDFHVLGATLGADGVQVRAEVVVEHETYGAVWHDTRIQRIKELPSGDHTIRLSLIDAGGKVSTGRHASAMRVITVNRDAPVE